MSEEADRVLLNLVVPFSLPDPEELAKRAVHVILDCPDCEADVPGCANCGGSGVVSWWVLPTKEAA